VFVTGIDHSGTSAVAGMLHHLGVMMVAPGQAMQMAQHGRYPLYEQKDIQLANQALRTERAGPWQAIIKQRAEYLVWGAKDPHLVHVFQKLVPLLDAPFRLIITSRKLHDIRNSWHRSAHFSETEIQDKRVAVTELQKLDHLLVEYEKLRANPYGIATWLDTELELDAPEVTVKKASRFVEAYRR
jgi:hypothetical protein